MSSTEIYETFLINFTVQHLPSEADNYSYLFILFICALFNDDVSADFIVSDDTCRMINELERIWKEVLEVPRHLPGETEENHEKSQSG
jgi:hypothetical protein